MDLSITRLTANNREFLAIHQAADVSVERRGSYVLCRPIGQEGTRTVAMFRVLSERLARAGCDVWRFDYHGTGDAPGEEQDQTLQAWTFDLMAMHAHASSHAATHARGPVRWFGMGLGANIALRAAVQVPRQPAHMVLWEPVLNGRRYAAALLEGHKRELTREFAQTWPQLLGQGRVSEPTLPGDVLGFDYGDRLSQELNDIDALPLAPALRRGAAIVCAVHEEDCAALAASVSSPDLKLHAIQSKTDWMSSQAMGTAIVPPDAIQTLMATLN